MTPLRGPNDESYDDYFLSWNETQQQFCKELQDGLNGDMREAELQQLVQKVEKHYQEYYAAKDKAAKQDILKVMHPAWKSPLENALLWIGGWRPTMVFQLAYAQAGQQIEAELADFLNGLDTPTMASLSSKQLAQISNLQVQAHKSEEDLEHRQAVIQQSLADQPLLTLAAQTNGGGDTSEHGDHGISMMDAMDEKVKGLEELMCAADDLRFECLSGFLRILSATQAAQYLIAAGQLHLALRKTGAKKEDESSPRNGQSHGESP